jgi:hypothetical protein
MIGVEELVVAAVCSCLLLRTGFGLLQWSLAGIFSGVLMYQGVLYGGTPLDAYHSGIAGAEPRVMTYTVAVALVGMIGLVVPGIRPSWTPIAPLAVFICLWTVLLWPQTDEVRAGALHLLTAAGAWVAGSVVSSVERRTPGGQRVVSIWILGWAAFEAALCAIQAAGSSLFFDPGALVRDGSLKGRVGGSLGHPSIVGKLCFLLMMVALPWLSSPDRALRRRAVGALLLMVVPLVLSGGRANALAALSLVVLAFAFDDGPRRWSRRFRLLAIGLVVGVLSAGLWERRIATGEDGSTRAHLTSVAFEFLHSQWDWVTGTGANSYVTVVGPTDWLTAAGWPVHNVFLLTAVELGLIGAVLVMLPPLESVRLGWQARHRHGIEGAQARVLLAGVPGIVLISLTGWGLLSDALIPWMLVLGYCSGKVGRPARHLAQSASPAFMVTTRRTM